MIFKTIFDLPEIFDQIFLRTQITETQNSTAKSAQLVRIPIDK